MREVDQNGMISYFNSIKVRLELPNTYHKVLDISDFNSIKVRLELPVITIFVPFALFQFHKGTIRTPCEGKNNTFKT